MFWAIYGPPTEVLQCSSETLAGNGVHLLVSGIEGAWTAILPESPFFSDSRKVFQYPSLAGNSNSSKIVINNT
jgi:hypothetical protein